MAEKKARVEASVVQSARGVATALGVPFSLWNKLSHDMALRILSHVGIRDVARATATGKEFAKAVGSTQQGPLIRLKELRQTHVELTQRDERDWHNPGFDNSVRLWHRRVEHLRIAADSDILSVFGLMDLATVLDDEPFFPSLLSLHVRSFGHLDTAMWQRLLTNCPKLVSLELLKVNAELPGLDWTHTRREWTSFVIDGISAPPAVFTAIANPSTIRLAIAPIYQVPGHVRQWTLANVQELVDKWKGKSDKVTELRLGRMRVESSKTADDIVLLLMKHFPNTRTVPWPITGPLDVTAATVRSMFQWRCVTRLPPFEVTVVDAAHASTVVDSTHDGMLSMRAEFKTVAFWRSWTLEQVQRLIPLSRTWTDVEIRGFKGEFDVKTLDWLSTHAHHLQQLEIHQPCKVTVAVLKQLTNLAELRMIHLGDGSDGGQAAHLLADVVDVQLETILALVDHVWKSSASHHGIGAEMRLCYGALTSLSDADVQALGHHFRTHVGGDVDIEILVRRTSPVPHLKMGSRQEELGDANVHRITFTADDLTTDRDDLPDY